MDNIKVSVIMPVYNASKYLRKSLKAVCRQTLEEIEIICVNDGSTDDSREIIESFAQEDGRIKIIDQKNLFAGVARNNGFEKANGEYVVFWDADDFFSTKALEIMYNQALQDNADICICNAYNYYPETKQSFCSDEFVKYDILPEETPFNRNDIPDRIFNIGANVPWNKMFRADFIREHSLKFQEIQQANDTYFVLMAIFLAERITYTKKRLVHYRVNATGSLTASADDTPLCAYESYCYLKQALEQLPFYSEENRLSFIRRAGRGVLRSLHTQKTQVGYDTVRETLINGGFEALGLLCDAEVYDAKWIYSDIQSVMNRSGIEHVIYKFGSARKSKGKIKSQLFELEENYAQVERKLQKEIDNNTKLNNKLSEKKEIIKEKNKEIKAKNKEIQKKNVKIEEAREKIKNKNQKIKDANKKIKDANKTIEKKNQRIKEVKEKIEKKNLKIEESKNKIQKKNTEIKALKTRLDDIEKELDETRTELSKKSDKLQSTEKKLSNLRAKWYVRVFSRLERMAKRLIGK